MTTDQQLLCDFLQNGSRVALDELIKRYLGLVYSSALRQVRETHLAEDITQAVFLVLMQKAGTIRSGVAVGGWLLAVTRRAVLDAIRKQEHERRRERMMAKPEMNDAGDQQRWDELSPLLDAAVNELRTRDRDAVVLRFFENRSFADVGLSLRVTEEAARKRVSRALDRLRALLARRGVHDAADALGAVVLTHAVGAAPPHVMPTAVAADANPRSISIAKGVIHMMIKAKAVLLVAITAVILTTGGGTVMFINATRGQQSPPALSNGGSTDSPSPGFRYAGVIADSQGQPIANVKVTASYQMATGGMGYIDQVATDRHGRFKIDRSRAISGELPRVTKIYPIRLAFDHSDFVYAQLEDISQLPLASLDDLHITLQQGNSYTGKAIDASGAAVGQAMVEAAFGKDAHYTRMSTTASDGTFTLHGLPQSRADIRVLSIVPGSPILSGHLSVPLGMASEPAPEDDAGFPLRTGRTTPTTGPATQPTVLTLQPVNPPASAVHTLFGMKLADVNQSLANDLFLFSPQGVVILDPGPDSQRLKIGELQRGDQFWMVGPHKIVDFDDMVQRLIAGYKVQEQKHPEMNQFKVRVVYNFTRRGQSGSMTDYMPLTKKDLDELAEK